MHAAKKPLSPTLSKHLLEEASRFLIYPAPSRRTRHSLMAIEMVHDALLGLTEWRKTFVPEARRNAIEVLWSQPNLLDQTYTREVLQTVPEMVTRSLAPRAFTLAGIADEEAIAYLREAANSYILGLPLATVALSRAAVERALKQACAKRFGARAVDEACLEAVIERFARKVVSKSACDLADTVRKKGNEVLHPKGRTGPSMATSLEVLDAARTVVQALCRV